MKHNFKIGDRVARNPKSESFHGASDYVFELRGTVCEITLRGLSVYWDEGRTFYYAHGDQLVRVIDPNDIMKEIL